VLRPPAPSFSNDITAARANASAKVQRNFEIKAKNGPKLKIIAKKFGR